MKQSTEQRRLTIYVSVLQSARAKQNNPVQLSASPCVLFPAKHMETKAEPVQQKELSK